ncbi:hypothetical protein NEF87_001784 [Candidatus Lokiarchaeum ossiferum]|uniref:B box-type domain-containing protein n=1 Tax=Candidatus Lokiarchaeum ossiferum TaxID=2951803 RepID=A0ABY6HSF4_9ARCH|nr:hypothetical protein NEF87_001784 [Candidatus Lokiarchaeum sp. B-35]
MVTQKCYYHNNFSAAAICCKCGKPVCAECRKEKRTVNYYKSRNIKKSRTTIKKYCPVCKYQEDEKIHWGALIGLNSFMLLILYLGIVSVSNNIFIGLIIILLAISLISLNIYYYIFKLNENRQEATRKKLNFMKKMELSEIPYEKNQLNKK